MDDKYVNCVKNYCLILIKKISLNRKEVHFFIDNCNPHKIKNKFNSVIVKFLPPNMTSKLQLMNQNIKENFKIFYRKKVKRKIINNMDEVKSFSINLLKNI